MAIRVVKINAERIAAIIKQIGIVVENRIAIVWSIFILVDVPLKNMIVAVKI